jgi:O-antigen/teichoic acid export membrane protein
METVRRIAKNTIILAISNILSKLLGFLFIMYVSRYLSVEGYGTISFAIAFTAIYSIFTDLGMSTLTVRNVSRDRSYADKYMGSVIIIKSVLVLLTLCLVAISIGILGYSGNVIYVVYLVTISMIIDSFSGIFYAIFQAYEKMEYNSIGQVLKAVLLLSGAIIAIYLRFTVTQFAAVYVVASAIILIYLAIICLSNSLVPNFSIDHRFCKYFIIESLPFALVSVFVMVNQRIDSILLSKLTDMAHVGWYNAAYNLVLMLEFIPAAFISSLYPYTSIYYKSKYKLDLILNIGVRYMFMTSLPMGILVTLLADKIIGFIYGRAYIPSTASLQILIWSEVIIFIALVFNNQLISVNKQMLVTKQVILVAIVNIIVNLLLIPGYGIIGSSIATVVSSLISFIILSYYIYKEGFVLTKNSISYCSKVLLAGAILLAYVYMLKEINVIILISSSTLLYLLSLCTLRTFDDFDIYLFKKLIAVPYSARKYFHHF